MLAVDYLVSVTRIFKESVVRLQNKTHDISLLKPTLHPFFIDSNNSNAKTMSTILVTGATVHRGGATINALPSSNSSSLKILGLTRNPDSSSAKSLSNRGITLIKGDLSDRKSILNALKDVDATHLVTNFRGLKGVEEEIEQGKLFADCAKESGTSIRSPKSRFIHKISIGLKHLAYSSAAGAGDAPSIPHFHSKTHN